MHSALYQFLLVVSRGQEHEAREALQEMLLRVARSARVFDDEEAFWCWLKAVARNAARDGGRKQRRYLALLERFSLRRRTIEHETSDGAESRRRNCHPAPDSRKKPSSHDCCDSAANCASGC